MNQTSPENLDAVFKQLFDLLKHLTTLSSGAILLAVTVWEKLYDSPEFPASLFGALGLFFLSIVGSITSMFGLALGASTIGETRLNKFTVIFGAFLGIVGFIFALLFVVVSVLQRTG